MAIRLKITIVVVALFSGLCVSSYLATGLVTKPPSTATTVVVLDSSSPLFLRGEDSLTTSSSEGASRHMRLVNNAGVEILSFTLSPSSGAISALVASNPSALPVMTKSTHLYVTAVAVFLTLVAMLCVLALTYRAILRPIYHLSLFMRKISAANNLSLRVPSDETHLLGGLIESVNGILDTTEHSYVDMLKARYDAERANKGKSLFISKVSHELRTPIHSITGMLRILLKQEQAPGKRQYIQMAKDSADALLDTINEVLDYSKMQSGGLSLEREEFNLADTIRSTVEHLIPRFEEKPGIALCWDMSPGLPETVIGDSVRIKNILVNLLGNSFKFTEHGHVVLEVGPYQPADTGRAGVRFTVTDSGIGIPKDKLTEIFEPFSTLDERSARMYAGTGLGLAIVKQIAEQMGGSVSVSSREGEGSTFVVDLSLETPSSKPVTAAVEPKNVAMLCEESPRERVTYEGFQHLGCKISRFHFDDSNELAILLSSVHTFDLLYVIKSADILIDELTPLLRAASQHDVPVVLSRPSSEFASSENFAQPEACLQGLQPMCPLDVLRIAAGTLIPNTAIVHHDDSGEPAQHKLNILIADDAKTNRIILKTLLEEAGHSVEVVENGKQLLEKITRAPAINSMRAIPYDLVLTDIQMPIMDGLTATQNFREIERREHLSKKLPIVAVTSYALPEECSQMLALGIDHIITKPISPKRLSRLISQITSEEFGVADREDSAAESHQEFIQELCQITESIVSRVSAIADEVRGLALDSTMLDISILDVYERSGNSMKRTGLILSGFLESYSEPLTILESTSMPVSEPTTFRRAAHSLKGILLDIGANGTAELAGQLEKQALENAASITQESIKEFCNAVRSTALIIQEVVEALPSVEVFSALPPIEDAIQLH